MARAARRFARKLCLLLVCVSLGGVGLVGCDDYVPPEERPDQGGGDDNNDPDDGPFTCPDGESFCQPDDFTESERVPFSTTTDYLTVKTGGQYRPIFMKGVNLGVGLPGTRAGHLAATKEDYSRWLQQMTDNGVNTLRIYTLHYPRFYEALAEHNQANSDNPIWVLHGIWLHEEFEGLHNLTEGFRQNIREAVDCTHGNCHIEHRFGKAYGTYETNISQWNLGWIIGREVTPGEVVLTNELYEPEDGQPTSFDGEHVRVESGQPTEVWWAEQVEFVIDYELSNYNQTRPLSVSSWPTLDPLEHPTEGEEWTEEDIESFDMSVIEAVDAPGGLFATYHAYPYYPDFIINDPDYQEFSDDEGPNSYLGYLFDLRQHHSEIPVFIGETGVSSSWGSAHWSYQRDMNHGGHTEVEMGEVGGRLFRNAYEANTAGAAFFAWIDEWWKPTWITDLRDSEEDRRAFWHNVTAPEQNFGLLAFDLGEPQFGEKGDSFSAGGLVENISLVHDAAFFHVRLDLAESFASSDELVVAFDTYGDAESGQFDEELGESVLPNGIQTENRNEFALVIEGTDKADLMVTEAYDTYRIWHGTPAPESVYSSTKTDGAPWKLVTWLNSQVIESKDGESRFPETKHEIGHLSIRAAGETATSHDAVVVHDDHIDIRIPWTLLNVKDPARLKVLHASKKGQQKGVIETAVTNGIAVGVAHNGDLLGETDRYRWEEWGRHGDITDIPAYEEREKPALEILGDAMDELPYWMD